MVPHARRDGAAALTSRADVFALAHSIPSDPWPRHRRRTGAAVVALVGLVLGAVGGAAQSESAAAPACRDGLAALHSFEYEDANAAFAAAQQADPDFALAYWGEAMTYHQSLWGGEDVAAGRRVLARLAARPSAAPRDARTRGLVAAVTALFGDGDGPARRRAYADAMAALHRQDQADPDVAALYALARLGTASRSLAGGSDAHEGHSAELAGSALQAEVAALLSRVLAAHPTHPGALHYLLHTYDDPAHAALGLAAAATYAGVAPESSHARHMPAHIFVQLGRWADAEASDRAAWAASQAWVARRGLPPAMQNFHALAWRQYELLQLGRIAEAGTLLDELAPVVATTRDVRLLSDLASMRARQAVESRQWQRLGRERNFANVNELCAIGFSAARDGNPALAELARQTLAARAVAAEEGALRPAIAIMERQVAAVMALVSGRGADAVAILRDAARAELALPAPLGLPIPIVPAPELLGEVLLELNQPAEARTAFEQALSRTPNRTRSVLGLARAAARLDDDAAARTHYTQVLANYAAADAGLPEIAEARAALDAATSATAPTALRSRPVVLGFVGLLALGLVALGWRVVSPRSSAASQPNTATTVGPRKSKKRHRR